MRYDGTAIFGAGILGASILTLLTPVLARWNVWALIVLRVAEGLSLVSFLVVLNIIYRVKYVSNSHLQRSRLAEALGDLPTIFS